MAGFRPSTARGRCMCGAVQLKVEGPMRRVIFCHCRECRRWSGHYYGATQCASKDLTIEGGADNIRWYQSSNWASRAFCAECGSSLFYQCKVDGHASGDHAKEGPGHNAIGSHEFISISAGLFDDDSNFSQGEHIYCEERGGYYHLPAGAAIREIDAHDPSGGGTKPNVDGRDIGQLNHIAIAVPSLAALDMIVREKWNRKLSKPVDLPEHGVRVAVMDVGNSQIEFLEKLSGDSPDDSPIAAFLDRHPHGGLHHICFTVEDIFASAKHLQAQGVRLLGGGVPKDGFHGRPVLFLHPKDFGGVLVELQQF